MAGVVHDDHALDAWWTACEVDVPASLKMAIPEYRPPVTSHFRVDLIRSIPVHVRLAVPSRLTREPPRLASWRQPLGRWLDSLSELAAGASHQ